MLKTVGKLIMGAASVTFAACELVAGVKCVNEASSDLMSKLTPQPEPEPESFWERKKRKKKDKKK